MSADFLPYSDPAVGTTLPDGTTGNKLFLQRSEQCFLLRALPILPHVVLEA